jgi:hypothetical protein
MSAVRMYDVTKAVAERQRTADVLPEVLERSEWLYGTSQRDSLHSCLT